MTTGRLHCTIDISAALRDRSPAALPPLIDLQSMAGARPVCSQFGPRQFGRLNSLVWCARGGAQCVARLDLQDLQGAPGTQLATTVDGDRQGCQLVSKHRDPTRAFRVSTNPEADGSKVHSTRSRFQPQDLLVRKLQSRGLSPPPPSLPRWPRGVLRLLFCPRASALAEALFAWRSRTARRPGVRGGTQTEQGPHGGGPWCLPTAQGGGVRF
jgi:hypothetical protein